MRVTISKYLNPYKMRMSVIINSNILSGCLTSLNIKLGTVRIIDYLTIKTPQKCFIPSVYTPLSVTFKFTFVGCVSVIDIKLHMNLY